MTPEQLAEFFHSTYERLAPAFGWRTKKGCNVPFAQLPQRNKALMIATCQTVLNALQDGERLPTAHNSAMDAIALQKSLFTLFSKYMSSADSSILVKEVLVVVQQHQ